MTTAEQARGATPQPPIEHHTLPPWPHWKRDIALGISLLALGTQTSSGIISAIQWNIQHMTQPNTPSLSDTIPEDPSSALPHIPTCPKKPSNEHHDVIEAPPPPPLSNEPIIRCIKTEFG